MDANNLMLNRKLRFGTVIAITLLISILASCSDEQEITAAETITAFINVKLVPMTAEVVVENQTVLVEQGKIIQISPSQEITVPEHATVIDGAGAYLMLGLASLAEIAV